MEFPDNLIRTEKQRPEVIKRFVQTEREAVATLGFSFEADCDAVVGGCVDAVVVCVGVGGTVGIGRYLSR